MLDKLKQILTFVQHHPGMSLSMLMHLGLFAFLLVSFPQCQRKAPPEIIISVDLLPISQKTNVENKQATTPKLQKEQEKPIDKPKPIEKEPEIKKEDPNKIPEKTEEVKKQEAKPEPESEKEAIPIKDNHPKKEEEKKTDKPKAELEKKKKPAKPKVSEYDALLKTLEDSVKKNDKKEKVTHTTKGPSDVGSPLSLSVKDSIKKQIERCWNPPAGNKDAGKLQILLNISFNRDASVASVKIIDTIKYGNDELYKVAADAAVRAVYKCSPLQDLPIDQYNLWKNLELNFDPSNLIY